jgi:Holliday junction resolvase RusA-like endonuclease
MPTARIVLPFPISVNGMFPTRGNVRVPSPKYRAWRDEAGYRIKSQKPPCIAGSVNVRIDLVAPDARRRDCDNYVKGVLDAIVKAGVITDDSAIRRLSIGWEEAGEPCTVIVTSVEKSAA